MSATNQQGSTRHLLRQVNQYNYLLGLHYNSVSIESASRIPASPQASLRSAQARIPGLIPTHRTEGPNCKEHLVPREIGPSLPEGNASVAGNGVHPENP